RLKHVVERCAFPGVRCRPGKHKSQVSEVGCGLFDLLEAPNAHYGRYGLMPPGDDDIRSLLGVSDESSHPPLGSFTHAHFASILQQCYAMNCTARCTGWRAARESEPRSGSSSRLGRFERGGYVADLLYESQRARYRPKAMVLVEAVGRLIDGVDHDEPGGHGLRRHGDAP